MIVLYDKAHWQQLLDNDNAACIYKPVGNQGGACTGQPYAACGIRIHALGVINDTEIEKDRTR